MGVVGALILISANELGGKVFGFILVLLAVFIFKKLKSEFSVYLNSSSGESQALKSKDKNYIDQVINALNSSIVHRG